MCNDVNIWCQKNTAKNSCFNAVLAVLNFSCYNLF
nr:MAG TPA: hypothetical protein [Caudoviricetes sp.]